MGPWRTRNTQGTRGLTEMGERKEMCERAQTDERDIASGRGTSATGGNLPFASREEKHQVVVAVFVNCGTLLEQRLPLAAVAVAVAVLVGKISR